MKITEALARARIAKGPACTVGILLTRIPEDERDALLILLNPETYPRTSSPNLSRAIEAAFGERIMRNAIDRHRKNECACEWRFKK